MKLRYLIKKTKAVLAANVIAMLLANVGGVGYLFVPSIAQAETETDTAHVYMSTSCTDITAPPIIGNGVTDILDFSYFSDHYSSTASICNGDSRYVTWADFDGSGCIDIIDKEIFATYFRTTEPNETNFYCQQQNKSLKRECPDIYGNDGVNIVDFSIFGDAYGHKELTAESTLDPAYNSEADFDQDGYVGDIDKAIFAQAFNHPDVISPYCVYENPDDQQAYIIVNKTVDNSNGGTAVANDFLLTVDKNAVLDEVAYPVNPGVHTAGETNLTNYSAGTWAGDCSANGSVTVALGETKTCTITNTYKVSTEGEDNPPADDIINPIEQIIKKPLLTLTVTNDTTTFVAPGGLVNYVATVENTGNDTAQNVEVMATLPNGIFFTDTLGVEKVLSSGGTLAPHDVMTLKYQGTVKNDTINGVYKDAVKVTSSNNPELNGGTSVEVRVPVAEASKTTTLGVTIQADVPFTNPGDTVKYTVNVTNTGVVTAVDTRLKVTLPAGQTFVETGSTTREWTLGDIAVGAKNAVTFDGLVSATASAGIGKISATATSVSISAPVTATMDLEVKLPQVLGAEITPETAAIATLPATGVGVVDYLILMSVGTIGLLLGARWWRLRHHTGYAAGK